MSLSINFGGEYRERLKIEVLGYSQPDGATNIYDANWLSINVMVDVGGFSGAFRASFLVGDFAAFETQIAEMYRALKGKAIFETLEAQLALELVCGSLGKIHLGGVAKDHPGIGSTLTFSLTLDQSQLAASLQQIRGVLAVYPVRSV